MTGVLSEHACLWSNLLAQHIPFKHTTQADRNTHIKNISTVVDKDLRRAYFLDVYHVMKHKRLL